MRAIKVAVTVEEQASGKWKAQAGSRATGTAWLSDEPLRSDLPATPLVSPKIASRETIQQGVILGTLEKTLDLSQPGMAAPL